MLACGQAYRAKRVILVYPWYRGIGGAGIYRRWTVTGADYRLETATVDVGRPETVPQSLLGLFREQALDGIRQSRAYGGGRTDASPP